MKTLSKILVFCGAFCVGLSALTYASPAQARIFFVGGRALVVDRPFRPGPAVDPAAKLDAELASQPVAPRVAPPKTLSPVDSIVPPKFGQHFLPEPGDFTPHHYNGVTIVQLPSRSAYASGAGYDPGLGVVPQGGMPSTIPGPRIVTPNGLQPGTDPYRPSPFDPDVNRRLGYKRF